MSLIAYRQEGGPAPAANTPATKSNQLVAAPTATDTVPAPIREFVAAVQAGNPKQIVETKDRYKIIIPLEFENLSKATSKTRNLIVTYELLKSGQISQKDYDDYIQKNWIGRKLESEYNKFSSTNYRAADGTSLKFVNEGPDAGKYFDVGAQEAVTKETHPGKFPVRAVSSGDVDNKAANKAYENSEAARTGMRKLDDLVSDMLADPAATEGGLFGFVRDSFNNLFGTQGGVAGWRNKLKGFINSEVVNNLPPGVASDKDIELARSGFPTENWDQDQLISYFTGYYKQLIYSAEYFQRKGEYITETGSQSGWGDHWETSDANRALEEEVKAFSFAETTAAQDDERDGLPVVYTQEEVDKLEPGTKFIWGPNNQIYTKD